MVFNEELPILENAKNDKDNKADDAVSPGPDPVASSLESTAHPAPHNPLPSPVSSDTPHRSSCIHILTQLGEAYAEDQAAA